MTLRSSPQSHGPALCLGWRSEGRSLSTKTQWESWQSEHQQWGSSQQRLRNFARGSLQRVGFTWGCECVTVGTVRATTPRSQNRLHAESLVFLFILKSALYQEVSLSGGINVFLESVLGWSGYRVCASLEFCFRRHLKKKLDSAGLWEQVEGNDNRASHYFNIYLISWGGGGRKHETSLESTDRNFYFDILFWSQATLTVNMQHPQKTQLSQTTAEGFVFKFISGQKLE